MGVNKRAGHLLEFCDKTMTDEPTAIAGSVSSSRTMVDGTLRISIDIEPNDAKAAFAHFGTPTTLVAIVRMKAGEAPEQQQQKEMPKTAGPWGDHARTLKLSSFFRTPAVWEAVGTDDQYLEWVKRQPSAKSGEFSEFHDDGNAYCVPAHVRRVAHGSGTGIKPPYSAIPLTNKEHQLTHTQGDSAIGNEAWWQERRIKYVELWCWETLKAHFGEDSWTKIHPAWLIDWAQTNNLISHVPLQIRNWENC